MKKSCMFSIIFYVILVNVSHLQSRDEHQPQAYFSAWPTHQGNPVVHVQAHAHYDQPQQDPFDLITPQNSGFTSSCSSQDWYQQHRQFVLSNVVGISLQGKTIKITPEDVSLINRICADNLHKSPDALRTQLSQSSAFNYAQHFLKGDNLLHAFTPDIFIDPAHFKQVSAADYRVKKMIDSAQQAIQDRHKREKSQLESTHKEQLKIAKKKSNSEENKVASCHKKEWDELDARHKQEKKHPLGTKKSVVGSSQSQSQVAQQASLQQVTKKSNISSQEIQKLCENNNNQVSKRNREARSKVNSAQDSSFQQVMDKRSKAFEVSVKNQTTTTEHIKINSQTAVFLQAQGIDTAQFQQVEGLPIQHQLTHELVDVLDAVAEYAQQHHYEIYQTHLTKYCAHLASLSQQSNVEGALTESINGVDCCHGLYHYMNGLIGDVTHQYQQMATALAYFNPVLDYGSAIAKGIIKGGVMTIGVGAVTTLVMASAPVATTFVLQGALVATALKFGPLCAQACINAYDFGNSYINGQWDQVNVYLDKSYEYITNLENVEKAAEFVGGFATAYHGAAIMQELQALTSLRPVIATVHHASGEVTRSVSLMTPAQIEQKLIASSKLLQHPEFEKFNMYYENIFGCKFFSVLPKSHPSLTPALEIVGMPASMVNASEQAVVSRLYQAPSQDLLVGNGTAMGLKHDIKKQIKKTVVCLHKRIIDVMEQKGGLERLSPIEQNAVVKIINIGGKRGGDLKNIDVQFSKNINHLFADRAGHLPNTVENQSLIMNLVKDVQNCYGIDARGHISYGKILPDGTQLWAIVRNNLTIENCGVNEIPKAWNKTTGFSALIPPRKK